MPCWPVLERVVEHLSGDFKFVLTEEPGGLKEFEDRSLIFFDGITHSSGRYRSPAAGRLPFGGRGNRGNSPPLRIQDHGPHEFGEGDARGFQGGSEPALRGDVRVRVDFENDKAAVIREPEIHAGEVCAPQRFPRRQSATAYAVREFAVKFGGEYPHGIPVLEGIGVPLGRVVHDVRPSGAVASKLYFCQRQDFGASAPVDHRHIQFTGAEELLDQRCVPEVPVDPPHHAVERASRGRNDRVGMDAFAGVCEKRLDDKRA